MASMIRSIFICIILATAGLLSACGTSPPVKYFGLQAIDDEYSIDPNGAPIFAVGPLRVPEHLKRPQMVSRGQGAERIVDDFNRWVEPLDNAIHATIAKNLDSLLDTVVVVAFPFSPAIESDYRIVGRIGRFDTDANGLAVLDIQWGIGDADGSISGEARRSHYTFQAVDKNDPASRADAMSETLEMFSRDVAATVREILR
jgi:uncharacterized lipoprotein YmbA